jgi:hypothetical protein
VSGPHIKHCSSVVGQLRGLLLLVYHRYSHSRKPLVLWLVLLVHHSRVATTGQGRKSCNHHSSQYKSRVGQVAQAL